MATRKRKAIEKTLPTFRVTREGQEPEEEDLKKVKARILKEIEDNKVDEKEWMDKEMDKNLKNQK